MRRKNHLAAGLACAILLAAVATPVFAYGGRGQKHHGGYDRGTQTAIAVCPYEDCTEPGRHFHDSSAYCGYAHTDGICDGSCCAAASYQGRGHHRCH